MSFYIFRNNTLEFLFGTTNVRYSDYDDISFIPEDVDTYIWFFEIPIKPKVKSISDEIELMVEKFQFVHSQIPSYKNIIAFTLSDIFTIKYSNDDYSIYEAINYYNESLIALSRENTNIKLLFINDFLENYNRKELIDWKYFFISQTIISPKIAPAFKIWFSKMIESIELKRKKCLVLDLDNTLWSGILGEDGIDGIKMSGDYPGKAFQFFQEALVELSNNGVILAVCSKNNEKDVLALWEKNPFVILKEKYISAYRINWNNKADNIKELSNELNIGLDSLVFVDDNPAERELVRLVLPEVEVPDFPNDPYELPVFFQRLVDNYFKIYSITEEDRKKTQQYKANLMRSKESHNYTNIEEYIRSMNIVVEVLKADKYNIPRIAQLTQKTNQFNLTTYRYTDSDILQFIRNKGEVLCLNVSDKFGDHGITGVIMIERKDRSAFIDTFLLSCRVLGKGIEKEFINFVLNYLANNGFDTVYSRYIRTQKNEQVSDFYDKIGFEMISNDMENIKEYKIKCVINNNFNNKIIELKWKKD